MKIKPHIGHYLLYFNLLLSVFASTTKSFGQQMETWVECGVEFDLPKKFTFETSLETRNILFGGIAVKQFFPQLELAYKINKRLDVSARYRHIRFREDNGYFYARHKYYFNFDYDNSIKRFKFRNRLRYHYQSKTYIENNKDLVPSRYLRDGIKISYNIKGNPIDPFVAFEVFYPLNAIEVNTIDEYRITGGLDFPVSKNMDMEIGLRYNVERFPAPEKTFVLLISYGFSMD
jgi:hypothetical protein